MPKVWVVILLTYNTQGFALGHIQVYEQRDICLQIQELHNVAPNVMPAKCEHIDKATVETKIMPQFANSIWHGERPIRLAAQ